MRALFLVTMIWANAAQASVQMWRIRSPFGRTDLGPFHDVWSMRVKSETYLTDVSVDGCAYAVPNRKQVARTKPGCSINIPGCGLNHTVTVLMTWDPEDVTIFSATHGPTRIVVEIRYRSFQISANGTKHTLITREPTLRGTLTLSWTENELAVSVGKSTDRVRWAGDASGYAVCTLGGAHTVERVTIDGREVAGTSLSTLFRGSVCYITHVASYSDDIYWSTNTNDLTLHLNTIDLFRCRTQSVSSWVAFDGKITLNTNGKPFFTSLYLIAGVPLDVSRPDTNGLAQPVLTHL
jgi:hypothetical protein